MLIQCLATIGALYLISLFVAVAAAAIYFIIHYLELQPGGPGPLLPPAVDSHLRSLGQDGCTPSEPTYFVLTVLSGTTLVSALGVYLALLVSERASRRHRELFANETIQPAPPSYGAC